MSILTIDIDGLDPSLVPTTGTPEPGGLGWYETLKFDSKTAEKRRIVGMDLVEFSYAENQTRPLFSAPNSFINRSPIFSITKRRRLVNKI